MFKIAEYYEVDLPKQGRKEALQTMLRAHLVKLEVLPALAVPVCSKGDVLDTEEAATGPLLQGRLNVPLSDLGEVTFEQKKEILLLQYQQESEREERTHAHEEPACVQEQELEIERLKVTAKLLEAKLQQEHYRLDLIREGKLTPLSPEVSPAKFDVAYNLKLLPKFNERDVDTFFGLFEQFSQATVV